LTDKERLEGVKRQAHLIEERARQQEQLMSIDRNKEFVRNVDKTIAVNDMYLEAINAKLKILD
jgi:hypothetical protein